MSESEKAENKKMPLSQKAFMIIAGVLGAVLVANYKNFSGIGIVVVGLLAAFIVVAAISLFMIHTPFGQKLDGGKTKKVFDEMSSKKPES